MGNAEKTGNRSGGALRLSQSAGRIETCVKRASLSDYQKRKGEDISVSERNLLYRCHCGYMREPEDGAHLITVHCPLCCCSMRQTQEAQFPGTRCLFTSVGDYESYSGLAEAS